MSSDQLEELLALKEKNGRLKQQRDELLNIKNNLEKQIDQIINAKAFRLWRNYNKLKEIYVKKLIKNHLEKIKLIIRPLKYFLKQIYIYKLEIDFFISLRRCTYEYIIKNKSNNPDVSILIPTYGSVDNLDRLFQSIYQYPDSNNFEILVCNDRPEAEKTVKQWAEAHNRLLKKLRVSIISGSENLGFVASINKLAQISNGDFLFFLNDDTQMINNTWLTSLLDAIKKDPRVGAVGSLLIFPDNNLVQHAGMYPFRKSDKLIYNYHFFKFFNKKYPRIKTRSVPMVTGAALLIRKKTFFEVGMLDYKYLGAGGFDDSDLCNKLVKAGYKIVFTNKSQILHYEGLTVKKLNRKRELIFVHNQRYYQRKWSDFLKERCPQYV